MLLLPVRGWTGAVMLATPPPIAVFTTESVAINDHSTLAKGQFDADIGKHAPQRSTAPCHAADGDMLDAPANASCGLCSVCHAVALPAINPLPAGLAAASPAPPLLSESFDSAEAQRGQKPPIS